MWEGLRSNTYDWAIKIMTFMASYGIWLRSYIHLIHWIDYNKNNEVGFKGPDYWLVILQQT